MSLLERSCASVVIAAVFCTIPFSASAREKDAVDYGTGLVSNVPLPAAEVLQVVSEVANNGIIRGSKEYEKDQYISGATTTPSSNLFAPWTWGGQVFFKVRKDAVDPRNFKDSNDAGTIAVRYIVQPQGEKNCVVRIDAVFVENFRRAVHRSNGSVESSEFKVIQDRLDAIELIKKQAADAEQERREFLAKKKFAADRETPRSTSSSDAPILDEPQSAIQTKSEPEPVSPVAIQPGDTLEEHVTNLRREVERLIKAPGAPLKSAPFHSAGTLKTLPAGTEVLIVITTPYWFGVETRDGQHGWIAREQLDLLP